MLDGRTSPLAAAVAAMVLLLGTPALALYSSSGPVVALTAANFDALVSESDGVAIVEFYAPWCGHCQALAPQYKKVASNLQGLALVGAVDCNDQAAAGNLCQRFGIQGFPTLKLFGSDKTKNPYTGALTKEAVDYNGPRTAKPMADAVTALLHDMHIQRLRTDADAAAFGAAADTAGKPQVLLFTNKHGSTNLYKALSMQLSRGLAFAEVHESAASLVEKYGVDDFPTLLIVKDGKPERYAGELKAPALLAWLSDRSPAPPASASSGTAGGAKDKDKGKKEKEKAKEKPAWEFVQQVEGLLGVLPRLEAQEGMALLALHGAEGEDGCKAAREAFLSAAGDMQAVVETLLLSLPAAELAAGSEGAAALARLGVDSAALAAEPCELQVVLLPFGADKADLDDYQKYSGPPEGKALQAWVTEAVPTFVQQIDDASTGAFLAVDPSGGKLVVAPKVLLFTNKPEAPGVYRALAMALRGRGNMAFGWLQVGSPATRMTVDSFKPAKVPSLTIILPTKGRAGEDGEEEGGEEDIRYGAQPYFGPLKYGPMRAFLEDFAEHVERSSGVVGDEAAASAAFPQVSSQGDMAARCTGVGGGLCLLALLDPASPSFEADKQELLALAVVNSEGGAFHFAWLDAREHRGVAQALNVLSSDIPALVALSPRRMRYATLTAAAAAASATPAPGGGAGGSGGAGGGARLRRDAVQRFMDGVVSGKVRTEALQALPELRDGGAAAADAPDADAADAAPPAPDADAAADAAPVEEEFDLSDILAEEVEGGVSGGKADRMAEVEAELKAEEERKAAEAKKASKKKSSKKSKKKGSKSKKEEL